MKLGSSRFSVFIAVTVCMLGGCASAPKSDADGQPDQVKVYTAGQLSQDKYEGVRHLWTDSWRTAFWLPGASSKAESIASLQAEAARLGANGLVNVSCIDQGHFIWSSSREPSVLCYGHAIRVR